MLTLKNVQKDFGGLRAVNGVSFAVPQGKIAGLIGPNGSGKSTLLNVISGTLPITDGKIQFTEHDITNLGSDKIFHLGLARGFQDPSLFFQMSVLDNMLLPLPEQKGERVWYAPWKRAWHEEEEENAKNVYQVLKDVTLQSHVENLASDLSGGQMKLLDLARVSTGHPKMLLLDEPTAGVAPKLAYEIFEQISRLREEQGVTFLIVEHRLEILFDFVDLVFVMHMGDLIAQGTPDEIMNNVMVREVYLGE